MILFKFNSLNIFQEKYNNLVEYCYICKIISTQDNIRHGQVVVIFHILLSPIYEIFPKYLIAFTQEKYNGIISISLQIHCITIRV